MTQKHHKDKRSEAQVLARLVADYDEKAREAEKKAKVARKVHGALLEAYNHASGSSIPLLSTAGLDDLPGDSSPMRVTLNEGRGTADVLSYGVEKKKKPSLVARVGAPKPPKGVPLDEPEPAPQTKKALDDPDTSLIARVWLTCRGREIRTLDLVDEMGLPYGNIASAIQGLCRNGYATRVARGRYRFKRYRRGLSLR